MWDAFCNSWLFRLWRRYFHYEFILEEHIDASRKHIYAEMPHGIFPWGGASTILVWDGHWWGGMVGGVVWWGGWWVVFLGGVLDLILSDHHNAIVHNVHGHAHTHTQSEVISISITKELFPGSKVGSIGASVIFHIPYLRCARVLSLGECVCVCVWVCLGVWGEGDGMRTMRLRYTHIHPRTNERTKNSNQNKHVCVGVF